MSHRVTFVDPFRVIAAAGNPPEFDLVERKCLAQGDSWFSIGSFPPGLTSNILAQLELARSVAVVNCARPGKLLSHMTDTTTDQLFLRLLRGKFAVHWDAILLSGGGNDFIDAAGVAPAQPPGLRLLKTPAERDRDPATGDGFISDPGWATFAAHITEVFDLLVAARDSDPINRGVPIVLHTYCPLMPRPAPAGPGMGPWLEPTMRAYQVDPERWLDVASALIDRLATLLQGIVAGRPAADLHLVDSRHAGLVVSDRTATGVSNDFENEIHPTRGGYTKLAATWQPVVDAVLG